MFINEQVYVLVSVFFLPLLYVFLPSFLPFSPSVGFSSSLPFLLSLFLIFSPSCFISLSFPVSPSFFFPLCFFFPSFLRFFPHSFSLFHVSFLSVCLLKMECFKSFLCVSTFFKLSLFSPLSSSLPPSLLPRCISEHPRAVGCLLTLSRSRQRRVLGTVCVGLGQRGCVFGLGKSFSAHGFAFAVHGPPCLPSGSVSLTFAAVVGLHLAAAFRSCSRLPELRWQLPREGTVPAVSCAELRKARGRQPGWPGGARAVARRL